MSTLTAALRTDRGRHVAWAVFLAGFSATFLFCGYEFIRSSAESIFLSRFSAESKPYALSCVPVMMGILIYLYGRLLSAVGSARAMAGSMLTSAAVFVLAFFSLKAGSRWPVFLLYVFKESYVVIITEQYWSFINSTLKDEEGRVFNGPVAGLGALGSLTGGFLLSRYAVALHSETFLLLSAAAFLPALALFWLAYKQGGEPVPSPGEARGKKGHLHLSILKENRTVLYIALVIFTAQAVSTLLDLRFTQLVREALPEKDLRTAFLGDFWMKVNIFSFSMQFLLAPLLLRYARARWIQTGIPLVHICTCVLLLAYPGIFTAGLAFLLFKGMDYSIFRASKETLYIPFSYDTRYRAKQVADAFSYRFSKGVTSVVLSAAHAAGTIPAAAYGGAGLLLSGVWTALAFPLTANRNKTTGN
jgi:ATP:ADP antiporter, AAA family